MTDDRDDAYRRHMALGPRPAPPERCPQLVAACCGAPSLCGLTGTEVDPDVCRRCRRRPGQPSTAILSL